MKPRFQMILLVDTQAHADTIKTNVAAQLVGKDIFEEHSFRVENPRAIVNSQSGIIGEWRFNNSIDRDAIKDWVIDQIQNHPQVKVWVIKALVRWHACTHDDSDMVSCSGVDLGEFLK